MMDKHHIITTNLEKKTIVATICGPISEQSVREMREDIVPLLKLFDEPITLIADLREASGDQLDAINELRALWSEYEQTSIGQLVRIFANDLEDQGSKITDHFHLKGIRKRNVTSMAQAIRYSESFASEASPPPPATGS